MGIKPSHMTMFLRLSLLTLACTAAFGLQPDENGCYLKDDGLWCENSDGTWFCHDGACLDGSDEESSDMDSSDMDSSDMSDMDSSDMDSSDMSDMDSSDID